MIVLTAKINLLSNGSGSIENVDCNIEKNNVSAEIDEIVTDTINGSNLFILGASKLGDGSTYANSVKSFIGGVTSNGYGDFITPYVITIQGESINTFTIVFSTARNSYPTTINVDGTDYANDSPHFTVSGLAETPTHTITISNWSEPNYPLMVQAIYSELYIVINSRNMLSMTRTIMERADNERPSWGIISNAGNIEFKELDDEIQAYIQDEVITQGLSCKIFIKDTLSGVEEKVADFYTDTWDYNAEDKVISVSLKDDLEEWQDILCAEYPLQEAMTIYDIYEYLLTLTPEKFKSSNGSFEVDEQTRNYLQSITCSYPYLESDNLWQQWQKFCEACGLYIYKNSHNEVVVNAEFGG
jgi:hypothetical protein